MVVELLLAPKLGALAAGALVPDAASSATLKPMMSTMLDTSFLTFSGSVAGKVLPDILTLQRYMASANSGK